MPLQRSSGCFWTATTMANSPGRSSTNSPAWQRTFSCCRARSAPPLALLAQIVEPADAAFRSRQGNFTSFWVGSKSNEMFEEADLDGDGVGADESPVLTRRSDLQISGRGVQHRRSPKRSSRRQSVPSWQRTCRRRCPLSSWTLPVLATPQKQGCKTRWSGQTL